MEINEMSYEDVIERMNTLSDELKRSDADLDLDSIKSEIEALAARKESLAKASRDKEIARKNLEEELAKGMTIDVKPKTNTPVDDDMIERKAFMDYVVTGKITDGIKRADATNVAADLGVMIPNTIQQSIVTEIEKIRGTLYNKVKKLNVKGGIEFPIGQFGATFHRITETTVSERQKGGSITGSITFKYKIGEIRLAKTLLQSILTVPAFEAELSKVIAEAYVKAMDNEILNGKVANNEMEGIATNTKVKTIEINENEIKDWKTLFKKVMAKLPLSMINANYEYVMSNGTFQSNFMTLANDNNTPVGQFVTYNGGVNANINGHAVTLCEPELFADFDSLAVNKYFGMLWIPSEAYVINSNMNFSVVKYMDHEKNQEVTKALVVNDGGVIRPDYIYLLKKVAVPTVGA